MEQIKMDATITIEQIADLLLNPENRDMVRQTKNNANDKVEEFASQITFQRKKIEQANMRLAAARTDNENPKYIQDSIESFKLRLANARKEIAACEKQIEILTARLPSEARALKVRTISAEIKQCESNVNDLIQQKGAWTRLRDMIQKAEELRKLV